jgi:hypothetical protein
MVLSTDMMRIGRNVQVVALAFALAGRGVPQQSSMPAPDPFQQRLAGVTLTDQDIIDGVAMLSRSTGLAVSIEHQLGGTIAGNAPKARTLTAMVGPGTVSEVLDGLCSLDQTFTWTRNGNMINLLPRALASDPNYFLNRTIDELTLKDVHGAQEAVFKTAEQLSGPKEQIAIMQVGTSVSFARPWTTTLQNVTVREVFDLIARQLGPTYGWQFSGAQDFRIITFHQAILPNPSRSKQKQSEDSRPR